jgi:hypothetical protein
VNTAEKRGAFMVRKLFDMTAESPSLGKAECCLGSGRIGGRKIVNGTG